MNLLDDDDLLDLLGHDREAVAVGVVNNPLDDGHVRAAAAKLADRLRQLFVRRTDAESVQQAISTDTTAGRLAAELAATMNLRQHCGQGV